MDVYQIWLVVAIVLVILEIMTAGFGVICFAIGAVFSALVAGLGGTITWQIVVFAVVCRNVLMPNNILVAWLSMVTIGKRSRKTDRSSRKALL